MPTRERVIIITLLISPLCRKSQNPVMKRRLAAALCATLVIMAMGGTGKKKALRGPYKVEMTTFDDVKGMARPTGLSESGTLL